MRPGTSRCTEFRWVASLRFPPSAGRSIMTGTVPQERPVMPLDWAPFVEIIRRHQRFLLTTHIRPDGDGLGSMQALAGVLRSLGKEAQRVIASPLPERY